MTRAKELPRLAVREYDERPGAFYIAIGKTGRWVIDDRAEAERIVYAVNRLPDYEAAVEALEEVSSQVLLDGTQCYCRDPFDYDREHYVWCEQARAALARLRDEVPA